MELRSKGATSGFGESYKEGRNVSDRKVDRSMRGFLFMRDFLKN